MLLLRSVHGNHHELILALEFMPNLEEDTIRAISSFATTIPLAISWKHPPSTRFQASEASLSAFFEVHALGKRIRTPTSFLAPDRASTTATLSNNVSSKFDEVLVTGHSLGGKPADFICGLVS